MTIILFKNSHHIFTDSNEVVKAIINYISNNKLRQQLSFLNHPSLFKYFTTSSQRPRLFMEIKNYIIFVVCLAINLTLGNFHILKNLCKLSIGFLQYFCFQLIHYVSKWHGNLLQCLSIRYGDENVLMLMVRSII